MGIAVYIPVSYTHLDVYKRQIPHRTGQPLGPEHVISLVHDRREEEEEDDDKEQEEEEQFYFLHKIDDNFFFEFKKIAQSPKHNPLNVKY